MIADVPLGAFLSRRHRFDDYCWAHATAQSKPAGEDLSRSAFLTPRYDETQYAELAAHHLGTDHQTFVVEATAAWETLPTLAWHLDEPFADSSALPTWYVARETRRSVTVALTGDAGDELFGGYERYRALALTEIFQRLPSVPRQLLEGTMTRILPPAARTKTRLRKLQRFFEHINEPVESRYLGWMTTFDEANQAHVYSDEQLDLLTAAVSDLTDLSLAIQLHCFPWRLQSAIAVTALPGQWSPTS